MGYSIDRLEGIGKNLGIVFRDLRTRAAGERGREGLSEGGRVWGRRGGVLNGWTDGQTDGQTDGRIYRWTLQAARILPHRVTRTNLTAAYQSS